MRGIIADNIIPIRLKCKFSCRSFYMKIRTARNFPLLNQETGLSENQQRLTCLLLNFNFVTNYWYLKNLKEIVQTETIGELTHTQNTSLFIGLWLMYVDK